MPLLLDTHIIYWHFYENKKLGNRERQLIINSDAVFVSAASIWEIAIKFRLGKLNADPNEVAENIDKAGFYELPVTSSHAASVSELPLLHTDPFDRLLIAQAIMEQMSFLTRDGSLAQYSDLVIHI